MPFALIDISIYYIVVVVLAICCCTLRLITRSNESYQFANATFSIFQKKYLLIYYLAMAGDWLQGPYMYALYQSYGYSHTGISRFFVIGFMSSMLFGTLIGSAVDHFGRKKGVMLYGITYSLACFATYWDDVRILVVGRALSGVATSLLYSAFESWMVSAHLAARFDRALLHDTFSKAVFGNSLVAITSGIVSEFLVSHFGNTAPFSAAIICFLLMLSVVTMTWQENFGDTDVQWTTTLKSGVSVILRSPPTLLLGILQSCFEGSMYIFVLLWTPALQEAHCGLETKNCLLPFGWIFSAFMLAIMLGAETFNIFASSRRFTIEGPMRLVFLLAAISFIGLAHGGNATLVLLFCLAFEYSVGFFWPVMGAMRCRFIPEEIRSTVMNIFRVPLNFITICFLLSDIAMYNVFTFCAVLMVINTIIQTYLNVNNRVGTSDDVQ